MITLLVVVLICRGTSAVGGGVFSSVLAESRWIETTFSHQKQSCGVEKSCVRFVSLEIRSQ